MYHDYRALDTLHYDVSYHYNGTRNKKWEACCSSWPVTLLDMHTVRENVELMKKKIALFDILSVFNYNPSLPIHKIMESQNGWDWQGPLSSSGPTTAPSGTPEPRPRPTSRWLLKVSEEQTPHGGLCQCSITCTAQKCSWCSEGTSCVPVCAHCLLSWHRAPPRRAWLCPLCRFLYVLRSLRKPSLLQAEWAQPSDPPHGRDASAPLWSYTGPFPVCPGLVLLVLKAKFLFIQCEQNLLFISLLVIQAALEMHKDLTEIQGCVFPHRSNPGFRQSNSLEDTEHTLLFCCTLAWEKQSNLETWWSDLILFLQPTKLRGGNLRGHTTLCFHLLKDHVCQTFRKQVELPWGDELCLPVACDK